MRSWRITDGSAGIARLARILALAAALIGAGGMSQPVDAQQAPGAVIRVVHGLRGLVADVYLNGQLVLPTFQPERTTDPMAVPAGEHLVEIRAAGAAATKRPLLTQKVSVPSGFQGSLVAHLDRNGAPTLSTFADDLGAVPAGRSRVVVRHTASAENISVLLDDRPTIAAVAPSKSAAKLVSAGTYQVSVTPAGGGRPLAPPQDMDYAEGTANFMYLIGSQAEGTLGWAAVRITDLQTAPVRIQTGDGSAAGTSSDQTTGLMLVGAVMVAAGGGAVWSRTRRSAPLR